MFKKILLATMLGACAWFTGQRAAAADYPRIYPGLGDCLGASDDLDDDLQSDDDLDDYQASSLVSDRSYAGPYYAQRSYTGPYYARRDTASGWSYQTYIPRPTQRGYYTPRVVPYPVGKPVFVNGYYRQDGTYVSPHFRSLPRR
jgi:hypothetical protein